MNHHILLVLVVLAPTGCATQGTSQVDYQPANPFTIKNERVVERPQSLVWDAMVRELSKSFYVINNIERESRIINVSFNTNTPSEYVDCGRTSRTYTQGSKTEMFSYSVAESSSFKIAGQRQPHPAWASYAQIQRETSLEGRANIYVAPASQNSEHTIVSVNSRYILSIRTRGTSFLEGVNGNTVSQGPLPENSFQYIFSTNKPATTFVSGENVTCLSKGKLEMDVLDMAR